MSRDEAHFFLQRHNRCGEATSSEVFFQNRFQILGSIWGSSDSIFQALQGVTPNDISITQFYQTLRVLILRQDMSVSSSVGSLVDPSVGLSLRGSITFMIFATKLIKTKK